jgi:galactonate dehydratase
LREAVGDDTDIMVDFHGRTTTGQAIQYINAIEEFRPLFCEEPFPRNSPMQCWKSAEASRFPLQLESGS